jgi:glycosyltransferase involved in cell wall biosynthesis
MNIIIHKKKDASGALRIMAVGLRGIPDVPGGVETHAENLYPRLAMLGTEVTVLGRRPSRPANATTPWHSVRVKWLWSPIFPGVEAFVHTFLCVLYAAIQRPDVLHIHAIGPWLFTPMAKLAGLHVVVTHHGQDYLREKWSTPAKLLLRLGERLGMKYADERIVISSALLDVVREKSGRNATLIPNGAGFKESVPSTTMVEKFGLTPGRYVIQVSRLVPEKRPLDLVAAFCIARLPGWKLVLVGGAQGDQTYADEVRLRAAPNPAIVCTGFLPPAQVQELLSNAGMFVLPSSHEGLAIALLEAIQLGVPCLASDIAANREIGLPAESYFPLGNVARLAALLREQAEKTNARPAVAQRYREICARYDWDAIARATLVVMKRAARRPRGTTAIGTVGEEMNTL